MRLAILRGEPPVAIIGVELVTSLKGDFSSGCDGVESSILLPVPFPVVVLMGCVELSIRGRNVVELMRVCFVYTLTVMIT
jgi:hypothetical protein